MNKMYHLTGSNDFYINHETMLRAVQYYLNSLFMLGAPTVTRVKELSGDPLRFIISTSATATVETP